MIDRAILSTYGSGLNTPRTATLETAIQSIAEVPSGPQIRSGRRARTEDQRIMIRGLARPEVDVDKLARTIMSSVADAYVKALEHEVGAARTSY